MKSHGILSRYVRPGFKEGGDSLWDKTKKVWEKVTDGTGNPLYDLAEEAQKEKDRTTEDWRRKKLNYFRGYNVALVERKRDAGEDRMGFDDDVTESGFTFIDPSKFDEEKIRDGTQMIFNMDADGNAVQDGTGFLGSQGFQDIPFMFYDSQDDFDYWLDKTKLDDMAFGRPYADDTTWDQKLHELYKFTKRGTAGGLLTLPEHAAAAYRFLQPFDALGGVGPLDTFNPKNEAQKELVESSEMYRVPGYSKALNWLTMDPDRVPGIVPATIAPRDNTLYKDTLYEDEMYSQLMDQANMRNQYEGMSDDEVIDELMTLNEGYSRDDVSSWFNESIKPTLDMTEKEFDRDIWAGNRDNLSHSKPAWMTTLGASFALPIYGPAGLTAKAADLVKKGNKFSQAINKAKKGSRTLRWGDSSLGIGVPQLAGEYAVRKLTQPEVTVDLPYDSEDEDSIYP